MVAFIVRDVKAYGCLRHNRPVTCTAMHCVHEKQNMQPISRSLTLRFRYREEVMDTYQVA